MTGEDDLIRLFREHLPAADRGVPFGDDMAGIVDAKLLWSTDMLMDGVDFDSSLHAWRLIGRKALAVNLSDCAAMAARPVSALCGLCLDRRVAPADALDLLLGAQEIAAEFGCAIVGGDTNSWDKPTVIAFTIAGACQAGNPPVLRSGALPGDGLWVSGRLGGSLLGRHLSFTPRVELALRLHRELPPHAMIDISDGLARDAWRMCEASGCGVELDAALLGGVVHADAHKMAADDGREPLDHVLNDGEDFELALALPAQAAGEAFGLHRVGTFVTRRDLRLVANGQARPIAPGGWQHAIGDLA
jgi:thiamine-monophosphate kinase